MAELVLRTLPLQGEEIKTNIFLKGNIIEISHPKGILEELIAEYDLEKPKYFIENVKGPPDSRRYDVKCTVKDLANGNIFVAIGKGERKIKDAEHVAARKLLKMIDKTYYFSE